MLACRALTTWEAVTYLWRSSIWLQSRVGQHGQTLPVKTQGQVCAGNLLMVQGYLSVPAKTRSNRLKALKQRQKMCCQTEGMQELPCSIGRA